MANRKLTDDEIVLPITQDYLLEIIYYDLLSGRFFWKKYRSATATIGSEAGNTSHIRGYRVIKINKKPYLAHRLAWFYVYGVFPTNEIDHINGDTGDNRICNLRLATRSQNQQNIRRALSNNICGLQGVSWNKSNKKWQARIRYLGKKTSLGCFISAQQAHEKYIEEKRKIHEFCTI